MVGRSSPLKGKTCERESMNHIGVFGVGGYGREVLPLVREQFFIPNQSNVIQFVDDNSTASSVNGCEVVRYVDWLDRPGKRKSMVICLATGADREKIYRRCLADSVNFPIIQAKNALVFDAVDIGIGTILNSFVHLTSNIKIGKFFQANIYSYVAHDCVIGDFVTFAPRVMCNGNVIIEDHAYIGTGAIIRQGEPSNPIVIGSGAVVGMGAVVTKSVPSGAVVIGNPARPKNGV